MTRTRDWLKANKIYFETIAAALLGLMAIFVGVAAVLVASEANSIADNQAKLAEAEAAPFIEVIRKDLVDERQVRYETHLEVRNSGGRLREFDSRHAVFIRVMLQERDPRTQKTACTPLDDYYVASAVTRASTGVLETMVGHSNVKRYARVYFAFLDAVEASNELVGSLDLAEYLHVTYSDVLGNERDEYLRVDPLGGAEQIDDNEGRALFIAWDADRMSIDDLTVGSLINRWRAGSSSTC